MLMFKLQKLMQKHYKSIIKVLYGFSVQFTFFFNSTSHNTHIAFKSSFTDKTILMLLVHFQIF